MIGHIILNHRRFGRELYAIGGNRQAAIASGIDADARVRQVYVLSGLLAAFAGWMLAGRVGSIQANLGEGYIFTVMAAAVIGGISLQGGRGTMLGALGGVLLLSTIDRGLNLMNVNVFWMKVIQGLIIMFAMFIDAQRVRFRVYEAKGAPAEGGHRSGKGLLADAAVPVALVTGASRGIGAAIARALERTGGKVVVHYGTHAEEAETVCAEIRALGGTAIPSRFPLAPTEQQQDDSQIAVG